MWGFFARVNAKGEKSCLIGQFCFMCLFFARAVDYSKTACSRFRRFFSLRKTFGFARLSCNSVEFSARWYAKYIAVPARFCLFYVDRVPQQVTACRFECHAENCWIDMDFIHYPSGE